MSPRPSSPARSPAEGSSHPGMLALIDGAARLEKHPLARLITLVEQEHDAGRVRRAAIFRHLRSQADATPQRARVIGITGTPGSGKSTLIGRLALDLLAVGPTGRVALPAVVPTTV